LSAIRDLAVADLLRAYARHELSPVAVLEDTYARLDAANPKINAVSYEDRPAALAAARGSEARWLKGEPKGALDGVPVSIKSNVAKKGWAGRRGSYQLPDTPASFDAPAVVALESAGAISFCQTTMPEFGWKGIGDSPLHGITRNPWGLGHTTGGSSAGAGALGALGIGPLHLGTDGLGSVRMPASFCGLFGLKPSFGRVPAYPASPFGVLAHLGPMARTVEDGAFMLNVLSRPDARDMLAMNTPAPDFRIGLNDGIAGLRVGWSRDLGFVENIDPEVARLTEAAAKRFAELGAHVEEADPGFALEDARWPADIMWWSGAGSILKPIPPEKFSEMDPGFVASGKKGLALSALDLITALARRAALGETMRRFHERYDLLLTPTMPITAVEAGRDTPADGIWGSDWVNWSPFTYPFNLTAQPAATVPCGLAANGLPVGLQIIGRQREDDLVMRAARAFESAQPFPRLDAPRG